MVKMMTTRLKGVATEYMRRVGFDVLETDTTMRNAVLMQDGHEKVYVFLYCRKTTEPDHRVPRIPSTHIGRAAVLECSRIDAIGIKVLRKDAAMLSHKKDAISRKELDCYVG